MINYLDKKITTNPIFFQIAKDNKWEECWTIDLKNPIPSVKEILDFLSKDSYSFLAVEYQWNQPEGSYVLHIGYSKCMKIKSHENFITQMLSLAYNYKNFAQLIEQVNREIIGREYLFKQELELVRVGIFNHWFSSNPVDIWKTGDSRKVDLEKLKKIFIGHENLIQTNLNFQAMVLAYSYDFETMKFGVRHGIKVPSAKKIGENWHIDFELMLKFLKELENFKIS